MDEPDPKVVWIEDVPITRPELVEAIGALKHLDGDKRIEPSMEAINSPLLRVDRNRLGRKRWREMWKGHPEDAPKAISGHRVAMTRLGFIDFLESELRELDLRSSSLADREMSAAQHETWGSRSEVAAFDVGDEPERALMLVNLRQGQPAFRQALMEAYSYRCAISCCDAVEALEAAHIRPYSESSSNETNNGLLLRGDIHTLFDRHLLAINPASRKVVLSPSLDVSQYKEFSGHQLPEPKEKWQRPLQQYLFKRWEKFTATWGEKTE